MADQPLHDGASDGSLATDARDDEKRAVLRPVCEDIAQELMLRLKYDGLIANKLTHEVHEALSDALQKTLPSRMDYVKTLPA